MSDGERAEAGFHLSLEADEVRSARTALKLLLGEDTHEPPIRPLAREVLAALDAEPDERGQLSLLLSPRQMKITHTAVKLRFDDSRREEAEERSALRGILEKLPDEHTMRAIRLD